MKTRTILFLLLACIGFTTAYAQVGIGTPNPDAAAALEVNATNKGFLPPRLTNAQRNAIVDPAEGLTIFNTDNNCLQWWNGTGWLNSCTNAITPNLQGNATCAGATISVTPCAAVVGATLDDAATAEGVEYDWTEGGTYTTASNRALVEIGGQCWFRRSIEVASTYTGTNDWNGFYDNVASEPANGEGRLYQWEAAMEGSTAERAQGVCPTGWHIPSDCEWMYLENTLGFSVADQENTGDRGTEGRKLFTNPGNNRTGFTGRMAGSRNTSGSFVARGSIGNFWSSTQSSATNAYYRAIDVTKTSLFRSDPSKENAYSVRCLKD